MEEKDLKKKAFSGLAIRFAESVSTQLITLLTSIILARHVLPEEYGLIALVMVIISILTAVVNSGLGSALIQKKGTDQKDYSTVFWASLAIALGLYIIIFFASPFISEFFEQPLLKKILRIICLCLFLIAINSVQDAYVSNKLMFKLFFFATLTSSIVSGTISITMACTGYGVWALVVQHMSRTIVYTLTLSFLTKWMPSMVFCLERLKALFSFGWKILASGLLTSIYDEIRSFIIAGKYTNADLAFYTKGQQFPTIIANNMCTTINKVMFPIYSKYGSNINEIRNAVRRSIKTATYVLFPTLFGLMATSKSIIHVILGEKWLPSSKYLVIFCVYYLFKPIKVINQTSLKAQGKSGAYLILNLFEKALGISLILATMSKGVVSLALSAVTTYAITALLEQVVNGYYIKYTMIHLAADIGKNLAMSAGMFCIIVLLERVLDCSLYHLLAIQIIAGVIIYMAFSYLFKNESFYYIKDIVVGYINKSKLKNGIGHQ